ncbi:hypothetical protein NC652_032093 [Populus alba x Populus x berolinensis]|nr:hypothetical protein NC652_032093 [Populus alba x Populus x berolinensis]
MLKAAAMSTHLFALLAVILLLLSRPATPSPDDKVSCATIVSKVTSCINFISDKSKDPSQTCCAGVKEMSGLVKSKSDRKDACECLKNTLSKIKYDPSRIPLLSKNCGVALILPPISKSTDCSTYESFYLLVNSLLPITYCVSLLMQQAIYAELVEQINQVAARILVRYVKERRIKHCSPIKEVDAIFS